MNKKSIANNIIKKSYKDSFLPVKTPYQQLNFKNGQKRTGEYENKEMSNLLYNTPIDISVAKKEIAKGQMSKRDEGGPLAYYDPNVGKDSVTVLKEAGVFPEVIKHELLHRKFSKDSGEQDFINSGKKPNQKLIPDKYNPIELIKNKLAKAKSKQLEKNKDKFASNFNSKWDTEKNKKWSSKDKMRMENIDKHLNSVYREQIGDTPFSSVPKDYSKATERNSFFNESK